MSTVRILVLTSSTGGGHDARAIAFRRWVRKLYGWEVEVRVESMLEDSSRLARFGVNFYNFIQKHAPWFHHPYYLLVEGLSYLNRSKVTLGKRYYAEVISNFKPQLVFSVHDCLNRGYFQVAREILGKENVRCATYCSEFSGGYGYSRNWVEPSVDLYLSRTQTAKDFAVSRFKLDPKKIRVRGHFLIPRIYEERLSAYERHRFITERLGLRPDRKIIFLATGGTGANNHLSLLPTIKKYSETYQVLIVCGRNQEAFMRVRQWQRSNPEISCHVEGYCNEMHLFLQVSDMVVTRGGTTTCSEALHFECPIIFNGIGGVMPQEKLTVKYFTQDNAAVKVSSSKEFESILMKWSRFPERFRALRRRFRTMKFQDRPSEAIYDLVDLAHEALPADQRPALKIVGE
ncbi:MAG: glycosyltransferase [Opitutaceae bacterium]|nr:glycosyltransferase [Opitutaceae bacterium]